MDNNQISATDDANANKNACGVMELPSARNARIFLVDAIEAEKYVGKKEDPYEVLTNIFTNYICVREPGFIRYKKILPVVAQTKDHKAYVLYFKLVSNTRFGKVTRQKLIRAFEKCINSFIRRPVDGINETEAFRKEYNKWLLKGKNMGNLDGCIIRKLT